MIRRPPRSTRVRSSAASDVYKRQRYVRRVNDTRHSAKKQDWLILGECTVNNTNHSIFSTYSTPLSVNDAYSVPWYEAINPFASKYSTIVSSVSQSNPYFSPRS